MSNVHRINVFDPELRTSLECMSTLRKTKWTDKVVLVTSPGMRTTIYEDSSIKIELEMTDSSRYDDQPLYRFVKTDNNGSSTSYSKKFTITKYGASDYQYSFYEEPVRTFIFCFELLRKYHLIWMPRALSMTEVGSRILVFCYDRDDTEIYVELVSDGSDGPKVYRFIKKLYSNVTFTYQSSSFTIE